MMDRGQGGTPCPGEEVIHRVIRVRSDLGLGVRVVLGGDGGTVQFGREGAGYSKQVIS